MGQYHKLVNFTKKEFVDSYHFGNGAKLWEQVGWEYAFSNVTHFLLASCSGRGGGDFSSDMAGHWGGDRVALVGDYAVPKDFPFLSDAEFKSMMGDVWRRDVPYRDSKGRFITNKPEYKDISNELASVIEKEFEVTFTGDGWKHVQPSKGSKVETPMRPDMLIVRK